MEWPKQKKKEKENYGSIAKLSRFTWNGQVEFYGRSYVEKFRANCSISKTRKRLSLCKKLEICEYYATHKSYRETTRVFGLQNSAVRKICKEAPSKNTNERQFGGLKESKHFKGNKKGA